MTTVKRTVTILVSDLQDSTSLSSRYSLDEAANFISTYHEIMASVVAASGGRVAQIGGDDLVAYFGYPQTNTSGAQNAVSAALSALRAIRIANMEGRLPLPIRIGVHKGPAVIFEAANGDMQFGGDTPIVAARLQVHARTNGVLISEAVKDSVEDSFELQPAGSFDLKGLAVPVTAFSVQRPLRKSGISSRRTTDIAPLVGRKEELAWLQDQVEGECGIAVVQGEPGVGKTRLVRELVQQDSGRWLVVQADAARQSQPLDVFHKILDRLAEDDDRLAAERLVELAPVNGAREDVQTLFGGGDAADVQLAQCVGPLLVELLRTHDARLWIDDLQWMDAASRLAFDVIDRDTGVTVLATARPEADVDGFECLPLSALDKNDSRQLAGHISQQAQSVALQEYLYRMTDGNPLYIEQLTLALLDEGVFDAPEADQSLSLAVLPQSLNDLLLGRIDALDDSRELLKVLAALGERFDQHTARAVCQSPEHFDRHLATLIDRQLLRDAETGMVEFRHGLIRDAAYATMVNDERQHIHTRIAQHMESASPSPFPGLIAAHWEAGGQSQLAIGAYAEASEDLLGRALHRGALDQCERAMKLLELHPASKWRDEIEYQLLVLQGNTLSVLENYGSERRLQVSEATLNLSDRIGRGGSELIPILYGRWTVHLARSDSQTRDWAERLDRTASQSAHTNPPQIDVTTNFVLGTTCFLEGKITQAVEHLERALQHYDPSQHSLLMRLYGEDHGIYSSVWLQWAYVHAGRVRDAYKQSEYSDKLAERFGDPMSAMLALTYKMHIHIELQDHARVVELADAILKEVETNGLHYYKLIAEGSKSRALMLMGRREEANEHFIRGNRYAPEYFLLLVTVNRDFAYCYLANEQLDDAAEEIAVARKSMQTVFERSYVPELYYLEGQICEASGNTDQAVICYTKAYELADGRGAYYFCVKAGLAIARIRAKSTADDRAPLVQPWIRHAQQGGCALFDAALDFLVGQEA